MRLLKGKRVPRCEIPSKTPQKKKENISPMWEKLMQPYALNWSEFTLVLSDSMLMTIKINLKLCTQESRITSVVGFILATIRFIQRNLMSQHIHATTVFLRSILAVSLMLSSGGDQVKIRSKNRTRLKKIGLIVQLAPTNRKSFVLFIKVD